MLGTKEKRYAPSQVITWALDSWEAFPLDKLKAGIAKFIVNPAFEQKDQVVAPAPAPQPVSEEEVQMDNQELEVLNDLDVVGEGDAVEEEEDEEEESEDEVAEVSSSSNTTVIPLPSICATCDRPLRAATAKQCPEPAVHRRGG